MTGYERRIFRVVGMSLVDVGRGTLATGLTLVDLTPEPILYVPLADFSQASWVVSDYYRAGGLLRSRLRFGDAATGAEEGGAGASFVAVGETIVQAQLALEFGWPEASAEIAGETIVTAELSQKYLTDGLQHHWFFNEGSGQQLTDYVGSEHGELGSTDGSDTNDPSWVSEGLEFDGEDDWVEIPHFHDPSSGSWTWVVVVKPTADGRCVLGHLGTANQRDWLVVDDDGNFRTALTTTAPPASVYQGGAGTSLGGAVANWWMFALRRNHSPASLTLQQIRTGSNQQTTFNGSISGVGDGTVFLGKPSGDFASEPDRRFEGDIAFMQFFDRRLSDSEMTTLFDGIKAVLALRGISL